MADNDLVTKADLTVALDATLEKVRGMIQGSQTAIVETILDRVQEMVRDSQTEVLKAFYSFQTRNETRMRAFETTDALMTARMAEIERRLIEIEHRLLMNPPAA